jgi:predicted MPP superfamily phosphohydrolase
LDLHDWIGLAGSGLWVVGLSLCLATVSMAHYHARATGERTWNWLRRTGSQLALVIGGSLFFVGLALSGEPLWQEVIWGLCAVTLSVWAVRSWRSLGARGEGRR